MIEEAREFVLGHTPQETFNEIERLRARIAELEAKLAESEMANTKAVEALMLAARRIADLLAALERIAALNYDIDRPVEHVLGEMVEVARAAIAAHQGEGTRIDVSSFGQKRWTETVEGD